jgi:hypothetical protein
MGKNYILAAVITLITVFSACKKENNYPVAGKWQETKIRVYMTGPTGAIVSDTTYSGNTFTNQDYIQFNNNGTSVESDDHLYYPAGAIYLKVPPYYLSTVTYDYAPSAAFYILTPHEKNTGSGNGLPGAGQSITATVSNSNSLVIHMVDSFTVPSTSTIVYDMYYTR